MLEEPEAGPSEGLAVHQHQLDQGHQGQLLVVLEVVVGCSCLEQESNCRLEVPFA